MVAGGLYSAALEIDLIVPLRILPDLVFGSFDTNKHPIKLQNAPTSALTFILISLAI